MGRFAVYWTLRAVDIQHHTPARRAHRLVLDELRIETRESLKVPLLREDFCFEPVQRGRERDTGLPPLAGGQHPKRRILGQRSAPLVSSYPAGRL